MKNNFIKAFICLLLGALCISCLFACTTAHTHKYEKAVYEPTCTQKGVTVFTCACGDTYAEESPALGHDVVVDEAINPTCDSIGLSEGKHCSVCNTVILAQSVVPALGHELSDYVTDNNATCQRDGTKTAVCTRDGCNEAVTVTDENSKTDHSYVSVTVPPTCVAKGYTLYVCACGDNYFDNFVDTAPHVFDQEVVTAEYLSKEATCTLPAQYYKSCVCGKTGDICFDYGDTIDHKYSSAWTFDSTAHWHKAICGCDVISNYTPHQNLNGFCSTCSRPLNSTPGVMYDLSADGTNALVIGYEGTEETVVIAEEYQGKPVTEIYNGAFENNSFIKTVILPDNLVTIGENAFYCCTALKSVMIGNSVTTIKDYAFYICSSLSTIQIGNSVTFIGNCAFYGCALLELTEISDTVTNIGNKAFSNCANVQFNVYDNGKYLGTKSNPYFALITTVNQNKSTIIIHDETKIIADYAFAYCQRLSSIVIPDSVFSISNSAFYNCSSLKSVVIPDSVNSIGDWAFSDCTSLTSIAIPNSVTTIGDGAFSNCSSLTSIAIPDSVTTIGGWVFSNCTSLTIYCEAQSKPSGWVSHWKNNETIVVWGYKG